MKVSFRTDNGHYLCAENAGLAPINATRRMAGSWEEFGVERLGGRQIALKAVNGCYVCAEDNPGSPYYGRLIANREVRGTWETFTAVAVGDHVALQAHTGKFVHVRHGGGGEVLVNRDEAFAHELLMPSRPLFDLSPGRRPVEGRLHATGVLFANAGGIFRPLFVSGFPLASRFLRDQDSVLAYLDWAAATGFNGIRVMVGALTWASQTPDAAREGLGPLLDAAGARGLYVEVTALTDTRAFSDEVTHLQRVTAIASRRENAIIELANEPWHASQDVTHDWGWLSRQGQQIVAPTGLLWAEGPPNTDETDALGSNLPKLYGSYVTVRLNRSRDVWNMVRRVRELETIQYALRRPVFNDEPLGWGETEEPGRRTANPQVAFAMGALSRGFEVGLTSHADHAVRAVAPGPVQQHCHDAVVRGFRAIPPTSGRLTYKNAGHVGSPVKGWVGDQETLIRAYSFLDTPHHGWTVLVGRKQDPKIEWFNDFRPVAVVDDVGGSAVLEVSR